MNTYFMTTDNNLSTKDPDILIQSFSRTVFLSDEALQIFYWIVCTALCQLINVFGLFSNIINIMCFCRQGFKDSITISLFVPFTTACPEQTNSCYLDKPGGSQLHSKQSLAISDFGSLVTLISMEISLHPSIAFIDLPFDPVEVMYLTACIPHSTFSRVSSLITAVITLERCLCVITPLKIKRIVTPRRISLTVSLIFIMSFASAAPTYFVNKLEWKFSSQKNKSLIGRVSREDQGRVDTISILINNFIIPLSAFIFIATCTIVLAVKLNTYQMWRNNLPSTLQDDKAPSRNKRAAKMVLMISSFFIICSIPMCISCLALVFEPGLFFNDKYINIGITIGGIALLFESINASANIFIYLCMSSKYRVVLHTYLCRKCSSNEEKF